ncbi:MAG: glycosyltransferase [Planctomycetia bacterium]|nr:glycosyltransferase [Planctomycetia bacterium]
MTKEISVIVPIFNEQTVVKDTIERIKKIVPDSEIIAINDGSSDNTLKILNTIDKIIVINHPYNLGYGASLKDGIKTATGKLIVITDADGTYPIENIHKLLIHSTKYDMVVGARIGTKVYIPFFRRPAKWVIKVLASFLVGKKIPDINSGLRIFNKEKALEFMNLYPSGFSFTTTITLSFFTSDYTIKYIPINYFKRTGKSTIHPLKDFAGFITLIFRIIIFFRPLRFFIIPSLILIIIGIIYGIYQIMTLPTGLGQLPVISILAGLQIIFLGILADLIVKSRK